MMMPTFFGPTNIPPLEAFVTRCPAAVSDIYGMREQLGDAALFFDPHSDQEIASVMKRLWLEDELCATLSTRGREQAQKWGQAQFNDRLRRILKEIFNDHKIKNNHTEEAHKL